MGVDNDSKLIVGFNLDEEKLKKWMDIYGLEDPYDINTRLEELYPEIPKKERIEGIIYTGSLSLYIVHAGNTYSGYYEYYLSFFESGTNVGNIKKINSEHLELDKKVYKDLIDTELICENVDDISVLSVNYIC
jgi:hypothetical protein